MHFCIFKRNETLDVLLLPHKGTNISALAYFPVLMPLLLTLTTGRNVA